jgi:hypothetical protein
VIAAHHGFGEELLPMLAASGASAAPLLVVVWRTRLGRLVARIRRR